MSALGFQFCKRMSTGRFARFRTADASGKDISALSFEVGGAADIARGYVAGLGADYHAVIARYGDFELHPKLSVGRACGLRRKRTGNFHTGGGGRGLERIIVEQPHSGWAARIRFNVHGITNDRRSAGVKLANLYRAQVCGQPQREAIFGFQHRRKYAASPVRQHSRLAGRWFLLRQSQIPPARIVNRRKLRQERRAVRHRTP